MLSPAQRIRFLYVPGLAILLGSLVSAFLFPTSRDLRAIAGGIAIYLAEVAIALGYLAALHYSPEGSVDEVVERTRPTIHKWQRLFLVTKNAGPGLWIGLVARDAVLAVVVTRIALDLLMMGNRAVLPPAEREPIQLPNYLRRFLIELTIMTSGAVLGSLLRWWR